MLKTCFVKASDRPNLCFCEFRFELDGAGARIIVDDFCGFCNDLVRISLLADFRFQICVLLMVHYFLNSFVAFY